MTYVYYVSYVVGQTVGTCEVERQRAIETRQDIENIADTIKSDMDKMGRPVHSPVVVTGFSLMRVDP